MMTDTNTTNKNKQTTADANGDDVAGTRARATAKLSEARDTAGEYAQRAAEAIESNPMSLVVGGLAAGLVAGALIPRSEREREAMAPLGQKLSDGAHAAVQAARETGKAQLTASLLSPDAAKESARAVFDSAVQAVKGGEPKAADQGSQGGEQRKNAQGEQDKQGTAQSAQASPGQSSSAQASSDQDKPSQSAPTPGSTGATA